MKVGIEVRIDVTKIDKERLFVGEKGKYLTMTSFIDLDQKDEYGNNGFIAHKKNQEEQENAPILGNVKVFWQGESQQQAKPKPAQQPQRQTAPVDDFDDDIPF